jgi:transcription-repair coupling factor (superfamily II helicase)
VPALALNTPPLNEQVLRPGNRQIWGGLQGSSSALCIANCAREHAGGPLLLLTENSQQAERLHAELAFFYAEEAGTGDYFLELFPDWETLPYDTFSPHQDIISQRLRILSRLAELKRGILIVSVNTALHFLPPATYIQSCDLSFKTGQKLNLAMLTRSLESAGYHRVDAVYEHGEYALRGSILDLFPMGTSLPYRLELFDDEIESLRSFDPETQISREQVTEIKLLPGKEYPFDQQAIENFRRNFREDFAVDLRRCPLYDDVSQGIATAGIE